MPSSTDCWGIEVGANAVKAIRLQKAGGSVRITDFDYLPYKKVLTTPDTDMDEAIRLALDQLQTRKQFGKAAVVVSVPGHQAFARFASLPPVEPKKVPEIVKFEAVQQIPFPIDEVEWDYQTFLSEDSPDVEVGIFAITKERVAKWLANFDGVDITVHGLCLSPVAVYNALAHDRDLADSSSGVMLMDIGTSATDLIIADGGRIWMRTIPLGGHHFTEALVRSFKLSYSKAEKLKREAATSKYAKQIFQAMRPIFVDLVSKIQQSMGYYQTLNRDAEIEKMIGLGSTFRLPGLKKFLNQQLNMEVRRLDDFKKLDVEGRNASAFAENAVTMAPAYGLALQGLGMEAVSCNVLPEVIIREQVWKAKQPWTIAAAAICAVSAGVSYFMTSNQLSGYESNAEPRNAVQGVISTASDHKRTWNKLSTDDPRKKIGNYQRMLDYRTVWPLLMQDIQAGIASASVGQGDVSKLPRNERKQIFMTNLDYRYVGPKEKADYFPPKKAVAAGAKRRSGRRRAAPVVTKVLEPAPYYEVTIEGITPFTRRDAGGRIVETAAKFLTETLISYLGERGVEEKDRRLRPYRISDVRIVEVVSVSVDSRTVTPDQPSNRRRRRSEPTPKPNEVKVPGTITIESELPQNPDLKDEGRKNDQRFKISFRVELVHPEDARAIESQLQAAGGGIKTANAETEVKP